MYKLIKWLFKHYQITAFLLIIGLFIYYSFISLQPRIKVIMTQCVEELFQEMITDSINQLDYQEDELYTIERDKEHVITDIDFNTLKLNHILITSLNTLNQSLDEISQQEGIRHQRIRSKDWIDYGIPIGNLLPFYSLYGKGKELNVRLQILQNLNGEIITKVEPYGINTSMISISLALQLTAHVDSCLGKTDVQVETSIPLVMKVVQGSVPGSYRTQ